MQPLMSDLEGEDEDKQQDVCLKTLKVSVHSDSDCIVNCLAYCLVIVTSIWGEIPR